MARRTTVNLVKGILGGDFGPVNGVLLDLDPFIDKATRMVDHAVSLADRQSFPITLTSVDLELMERWLSAYFYTLHDQLLTNKSTEGASGAFVQEKLDPNKYKVGAIQADPTGCLSALLNRTIAGSTWLGKPPSEQIAYVDRD